MHKCKPDLKECMMLLVDFQYFPRLISSTKKKALKHYNPGSHVIAIQISRRQFTRISNQVLSFCTAMESEIKKTTTVKQVEDCISCFIMLLSHLDPRAAELAAGRRPGKKFGLAARKIAASRQPGRKKMGLTVIRDGENAQK